MYPKLLVPDSVEIFEIDKVIYEIPKCNATFNRWDGEPLKETFGGKSVVNIKGKPMFAELAIRDLIEVRIE